MCHERIRKTPKSRSLSGKASENSLLAACCFIGGGLRAVSPVDGESRAERATREGRALWRWAGETRCRLNPADYLPLITGGGQEHRVWHDSKAVRYRKVTHTGRYGWTAAMDFRYNKWTQEDEPFIGMGDATPLEYLDRLLLQNEVFGDDITLEGIALEAEGLAIATHQKYIFGELPDSNGMLSVMEELGYDLIPGIPANSEDCFSFYDRTHRIGAFDAHTGNFIQIDSGDVVPIDLVMIRADQAMHDYLCQRIDASANPK